MNQVLASCATPGLQCPPAKSRRCMTRLRADWSRLYGNLPKLAGAGSGSIPQRCRFRLLQRKSVAHLVWIRSEQFLQVRFCLRQAKRQRGPFDGLWKARGLSARKSAESSAARRVCGHFPVIIVVKSKRHRATRLLASLTKAKANDMRFLTPSGEEARQLFERSNHRCNWGLTTLA